MRIVCKLERFYVLIFIVIIFLTNFTISVILLVVYGFYKKLREKKNEKEKIERRKTFYFNTQNSSETQEELFYKFSISPNSFHKLFMLTNADYEKKCKGVVPYETTMNEEDTIVIIEKIPLFATLLLLTVVVVIAFCSIFYFPEFYYDVYEEAVPVVFHLAVTLVILSIASDIIHSFIKDLKRIDFSNGIHINMPRVRGEFDKRSEIYIDNSDPKEENIIDFDDILGYVVTFKYKIEYRTKSRRSYGLFTIDMVLKSSDIIALHANPNYCSSRRAIEDDQKTIEEAMLLARYTNKPVFYLDDYLTE